MNYHNISKDDLLNGDGIRVVLWVSGCNHHCVECQNPQTWDINSGIPFDDSALKEIENELSKDYISGITFSGGDPLLPENSDELLVYMTYFKVYYPNKTIWCYTGYSYESILERDKNILSYIDILVDGEYKKELRDTNLKWRGSSNQRVIDVRKSLNTGKIVLYCD